MTRDRMTQKPRVPPPANTPEPEKRRELRVPLRILRVETELNGEVFFGYATNLSKTGLFIKTISPRVAGTQVRLSFTLPSGPQKINCLAEIAWGQNYTGEKGPIPGMGLRFVEVSPESLELIQKFVDELLT